MTGIKLVAEMHKLKDQLCTAVRHNVEFSAIRYPAKKPICDTFMDLVIPYSHVDKATQEFVALAKLCAKSSVLHEKITSIKFDLHKKIPLATCITSAEQIHKLSNEKFVCVTPGETQTSRDIIANSLCVKLTELVDAINVKQVARVDTIVTTLQKSPHAFVVRMNIELNALTIGNASTITNLSEFDNVKFYFIKSKNLDVLYLLQKNTIEYLVGSDHKLYVVNDACELVHGSHNGELQYWV